MWLWIVRRIVMKVVRAIKAIIRGNREIMEEGDILWFERVVIKRYRYVARDSPELRYGVNV
jgi:hypothetical protein